MYSLVSSYPLVLLRSATFDASRLTLISSSISCKHFQHTIFFQDLITVINLVTRINGYKQLTQIKMVKGLAAVKWTAENNHKLLQAVALIHTGTLDYKKLASVFGESLSPMPPPSI